MNREQLVVTNPKPQRPAPLAPGQSNSNKLYEIRNPSGGFVVIEGPDDVVLQFFRHYGHPKRSKARETLQIAIVVAFTLVFPLGLVCSTLWMNDVLQRMWVCYQLYTTLSMYVYRYAGGHLWATTEEQISDAFLQSERGSSDGEMLVKLQGPGGAAIGAKLERTCHNRFGEAKAYMDTLIDRRRPSSLDSWSRSTTLCADMPSPDASKVTKDSSSDLKKAA